MNEIWEHYKNGFLSYCILKSLKGGSQISDDPPGYIVSGLEENGPSGQF